MAHLEEIKDYWNLRANGFSMAVEEELETGSGEQWKEYFQKTIGEKPVDILDDGCGPGFFTAILASLGHRMTAIDYSDLMVEKAGERLEKLNLPAKLSQMDAQNLSFADESFDVIVSRNVIWNLDEPEKAYREMHRVLRPGGLIIIDDGNMYLHMYDEEYRKKREEFIARMDLSFKNDGGLHGKHNTDQVDFRIIDELAKDLSISSKRRPQWDVDVLVRSGFNDIRIDLRGLKLPFGFRLTARKPFETGDSL